jgi:aspartyl-tRNA(Asn)/glutamyl-tRNA(Gln) amidotransferase subunit A
MNANPYSGLCETAESITTGGLSAEAYATCLVERIEAYNPVINAVIRFSPERALELARAADLARAAGPVGPLHGIPLAHKDMFYRAGMVTSCGSRIRGDFRPQITATVLKRLDLAGAFEVGALNMSEFAQGPTGHNLHFGPARNPWNTARVTGGSSSGSGAAVAAGFVPASLGSDTGGSVRIPAACCGITGLKPTWSRVSRHGAMPLAPSFDCIGPLARSARDCARMLAVVAGQDPADPTASRRPVPDYEAALDGDLRGMRIGIARTWFLDGVSQAAMTRFRAAVDVLEGRGARCIDLDLPLMDQIAVYSGIASRVEVAAQHAEWMRELPHIYAVHVSARMYPGYVIPAVYYLTAMRQRGAILNAFVREVFTRVDALATPTLRQTPPTIAETDVDAGVEGAVPKFLSLSANTRPVNYLGLPAITVPSGLDHLAMPTGLQLIGRPFAEARILRIADAYQRDTEWHRLRPPAAETRSMGG